MTGVYAFFQRRSGTSATKEEVRARLGQHRAELDDRLRIPADQKSVSTIHYRGTYSVPKALAELGTGERARAREIFAPVGTGEVSFDFWVDGRQLPRRIRIVTPASDKVHWDMTTLYVGFDEPLSIPSLPAKLVTVGS